MDARFTNALFTLKEMFDDRGYGTVPLEDRDRLLRTYGEGSMFAVTLRKGAEGGASDPEDPEGSDREKPDACPKKKAPTKSKKKAAASGDAEEDGINRALKALTLDPDANVVVKLEAPPQGGGSNDGKEKAASSEKLRIVFFPQVNGLKMEHIRKAYDGPADYCLVIHGKDKPKTNVRDAALELEEKLKPTGNVLQMFTVDELQYNVMQHVLQPRFERMSREEVERVYADHGFTPATALRQLPRILSEDKVARYMGLRHGDVVRVTRSSPTAGEVVLFKVCVAGGAP